MRISDWSSDVCSSDLAGTVEAVATGRETGGNPADFTRNQLFAENRDDARQRADPAQAFAARTRLAPAHRLGPGKGADNQIGRASCRERVCQYVYISVVAVSLQKKKTYTSYKYT